MERLFTELLAGLFVFAVIVLIAKFFDCRRAKKLEREREEDPYRPFAFKFYDYYKGIGCNDFAFKGLRRFKEMIHECADFEKLMNDPSAQGDALIYRMMYEFRKMYECPECGLYLIDGSDELEAYYNTDYSRERNQILYPFIPMLGIGRRPGYDGDHGEAMRAVGLIPDHHTLEEADIWVVYDCVGSENAVKVRLCDYKCAFTLAYEDIYCDIPINKRLAIMKKLGPCSKRGIANEYLKSQTGRIIIHSKSDGIRCKMEDGSYYFRLQYRFSNLEDDK